FSPGFFHMLSGYDDTSKICWSENTPGLPSRNPSNDEGTVEAMAASRSDSQVTRSSSRRSTLFAMPRLAAAWAWTT
ncbi:MAG: hypothetical protein ACRDP5_06270, partial [Streptosporangiaceae bacterium]